MIDIPWQLNLALAALLLPVIWLAARERKPWWAVIAAALALIHGCAGEGKVGKEDAISHGHAERIDGDFHWATPCVLPQHDAHVREARTDA